MQQAKDGDGSGSRGATEQPLVFYGPITEDEYYLEVLARFTD
jgi:hypothetical protein